MMPLKMCVEPRRRNRRERFLIPTTQQDLTMKVLLRNVETGLFYAGPARWAEDHSGAMNFERPDLALDCVGQSQLANMEVVMHFEEPAFDVPITIVSAGI
jgi:hypothetical protein